MKNPDQRFERGGAPSGASDMGTYGIAPIALIAPAAIGLSAPVLATDTPASGGNAMPASPGVSGVALSGDGPSPFAATLGPPTFLMEAAGSIIATMRGDAGGQAAIVPGPDQVAPPPHASGTASAAPQSPIVTTDTTSLSSSAGPAHETAVVPGGPIVESPGTALGTESARIEAIRMEIGERIDAVADRVDSIGERASETIDDLAAGVRETLDGTVARIDNLAETVAGKLEGVTETATARVDTITQTLSERVGDVTATTANLLDDVVQIDLGPVGGDDPVGGIATLVSMVSAADMFGLHDIGGGVETVIAEFSPADSTLSDFVPADVLLAMPDHDNPHGLLDGLIDGHHG